MRAVAFSTGSRGRTRSACMFVKRCSGPSVSRACACAVESAGRRVGRASSNSTPSSPRAATATGVCTIPHRLCATPRCSLATATCASTAAASFPATNSPAITSSRCRAGARTTGRTWSPPASHATSRKAGARRRKPTCPCWRCPIGRAGSSTSSSPTATSSPTRWSSCSATCRANGDRAEREKLSETPRDAGARGAAAERGLPRGHRAGVADRPRR